jgi:hypothetical protein
MEMEAEEEEEGMAIVPQLKLHWVHTIILHHLHKKNKRMHNKRNI